MSIYYIRKTGSDTNGGTNPDTDAVLTIARGVAISTTGDTLDIGSGTWAENITVGRTYQGAGMFNTHISNVVAMNGGGKITHFKNIKITIVTAASSLHSNGTSYYTDSWCDANVSSNYATFASTQINGLRSIFSTSGTYLMTFRVFDTKFYFDHCIFFNLSRGNYLFSPPAGYGIVRNSIMYEIHNSRLCFCNEVAFEKEEYNCCYCQGTGYWSYFPSGGMSPTSLVNKNPMFVDATGMDFRLSPTSPCIGAGHA